jgi:ATP-binding cassette subfamily B protein
LGGLAFAIVIVLEQALNFVQVYTVQVSGARAMTDMRGTVFDFLHSRRMSFFDRQPVGRLVTRVTNDVDAILELFASGAFNAVVDLIKLVGIVIVMVSLDWRLSLFGFAAAPVVGLLVALVRRRARDAFRLIRAKTAQMNANMNEQVSGMAVVQAFCREDAAAEEFDAINGAYRDANIASIKYEAIQDAAVEMVAAVCLASIVVSLGYRSVSFGTVVSFNAYLMLFFEPISATRCCRTRWPAPSACSACSTTTSSTRRRSSPRLTRRPSTTRRSRSITSTSSTSPARRCCAT